MPYLSFNFCIIFLFPIVIAQQSSVPFPNAGFFGYGYDIVKGSSFSNTRDTGFTRPIFPVSYEQNRTWNSWLVPDYTSGSTLTSCLVSGQYVLSSSGYDYQQNILESGSLSFDASFIPIMGNLLQTLSTGSSDYTSKFDSSGDSEYVYVGTYATCEAYQITLDVNPPATRPLMTDFVESVSLLDPNDVTTIYNFVNGYGTHYIEQIVMGGESYAYSAVQTVDYKSLQSRDVDVPSAINLLQLLHLGVNVTNDQHYTDMLSLQNVTKQWGEQGAPVPIPPCPDGNPLDVSAWQAAVGLPNGNPMPIGIKLIPVFNLLNSDIFPNDTSILAKQAAVIQFLNDIYCGMVPNCGYINPNKGLISYFWGEACPTNWTNFEPAAGRVILSVANASGVGFSVGTPLQDMQEVTHNHTATSSFQLRPQSIELDQTSDGINLANRNQPFQTVTASNDTGYAYMQLNLCQFNPQPYAYAEISMPIGAIAFFDSLSCPANWLPYTEADGRVIVLSNISGSYPSQDIPTIPGQPFLHRHPYSAFWQPASQPVAASTNGNDVQATADAVVCNDETAMGEDYGIPYYSALTCVAQTGNYTSSTPDDMIIFTTSNLCPTGWIPVQHGYVGRFPVAVTDGGTPNVPIGTNTIPPGSTDFFPTHTHTMQIDFNTQYQAYVGLTKPFPNYWAQADFITIDTITDTPDTGIPYISVLACVSAN